MGVSKAAAMVPNSGKLMSIENADNDIIKPQNQTILKGDKVIVLGATVFSDLCRRNR